jgi:hypothetical protein
MFDNKEKQLADLETAYASFIDTLTGLASEDILKSLGDWTPRDIAAHFIGWNRITLAGCSALREGAEPFYFYDGTNDYRKVNAKFITQFPSTDQDELLKDIASTKEALTAYQKPSPKVNGSWMQALSTIVRIPPPLRAVSIRSSAIIANTARKSWMGWYHDSNILRNRLSLRPKPPIYFPRPEHRKR